MSQSPADPILSLQAELDAVASPKTRAWWEQHMRHSIRFRGVGIPAIRAQLARWRTANGIDAWDAGDQLSLALLESPMAEDQLAGILYLQDYLQDQFAWEIMLERYEQLYTRDLIFDWNACDWFCVRVLGPTIARNGPQCAAAIAAWQRADHLWQARSAVVAFVPVAADPQYYPLIYGAC